MSVIVNDFGGSKSSKNKKSQSLKLMSVIVLMSLTIPALSYKFFLDIYKTSIFFKNISFLSFLSFDRGDMIYHKITDEKAFLTAFKAEDEDGNIEDIKIPTKDQNPDKRF